MKGASRNHINDASICQKVEFIRYVSETDPSRCHVGPKKSNKNGYFYQPLQDTPS